MTENARFLRNVLWKAALLFAVLNLLFAAWGDGQAALGRLSLYNRLIPGRERFPFGENPQRAYNLSLYNLEAMFAAHQVSAPAQTGEVRVLLVGDSSVWGTLLTPAQTLAGQLNALHLQSCDGRPLRFYNLGYPTLSLTKDVMILDRARELGAERMVWLVTLESLVREKQLDSPIVANNPAAVRGLAERYGLDWGAPQPVSPGFWQRTLVGQRRPLADLFRLQMYGVMWAATGVDQEYPSEYPPAQRDLEADPSYHGWEDAFPPEALAWDVLDAGLRAAAPAEVLLVNEPMLISSGQNADIRYNFFYPRWAYDDYRQALSERAAQQGWRWLDAWDLVPEAEFTNSAIHLTPAGEALLAQAVAAELSVCP